MIEKNRMSVIYTRKENSRASHSLSRPAIETIPMLYSSNLPEITQVEYEIFFRPPAHFLTKKQLLKRLLRPNGPCVGQVLYIFDEPRNRPKGVNAVPVEQCQDFRRKLELFGVDPCDQWILSQLGQAGQLVQCNLFDIRQAEKITFFKNEVEAQTLLGYMLFDGAHPKNYLTDQAPFGETKQIETWRREFSQPSLKKHLLAQQFFGPVVYPKAKVESDNEDDDGETIVMEKGTTFFLAPDLDRHDYIDPWYFSRLVLSVRDVLVNYFPQLRWHVEINVHNASTKFFGWSKMPMSMSQAKELAERIRAVLTAKFPGHDFSRLEIWPSSLRQIIAPLRLDKINLIGTGELPKVNRWYKDKETGERIYVKAYSAAAFLNWLYFDKSQVQPEDLAQALEKALSNPLPEKVTSARAKKTKKTKIKVSGGTNPIAPYKNRFRQALVDFWSGTTVPADDTLDKFVVPTLRVLYREGLDQDEAEDWVIDALDDLPDKSFSDRLSGDEGRLHRDVGNWVTKIWATKGVGGQARPEESEKKLDQTMEAWQRLGFVLHDRTTWDKQASGPSKKVVWTDRLKFYAEQLADVASCTRKQAKNIFNAVLAFVDGKSELALSMVGKLLEACGVAGKSQDKRHAVRKLLEKAGILVKTARYFHDPVTGYRHGDFFIVSGDVLLAEVRGEEEGGVEGRHTPMSIYLSSTDDVDLLDGVNYLEMDRRLTAEERFRRRIGELWKMRRRYSAA